MRAALREAGVAVMYPAAKQGICQAPYAVVQDMGTFRYPQSDRLVYTLLAVRCYVPLHDYPALGRLVDTVRAALAPLAPDLRPVGGEGVHTVNEKFHAHETYVEYIIQKKTGGR